MDLKVQYQIDNQKSTLYFGETLSRHLETEPIQQRHVIIITNQKYYDLYDERFMRILKVSTIDWYICRNQRFCNTLDEWLGLLEFISRFPKNEEYLLIGFGNEGVIQLTSFLEKTMVLKGKCWAIPLSISSFSTSLLLKKQIFQQGIQPVLEVKNLPEKVFLDATFFSEQMDQKLLDLEIFIQMGIVVDQTLLKQLFQLYPNRFEFEKNNMNALIPTLIQNYQQSSEVICRYGRTFEEAFYLTTNGHLLSASMKKFLGLLLQLFWNHEEVPMKINFNKLLLWLRNLGYPVTFPSSIFVGEYLENVFELQKEEFGLLLVNQSGEQQLQSPDAAKLLRAVTTYQKMSLEI